MSVQKSFSTEHPQEVSRIPDRTRSVETAAGPEGAMGLTDRVGIERAFDVIRHHTVHTKGYVLTALKVIEEFGNTADKKLLAELLRENGQQTDVASSAPPAPKKKALKKK